MRKLIAHLAALVLVAFLAQTAEAQQAAKVPRIGILSPGLPSSVAPNLDAFRQGLRALGYVEGKNIVIEYRYGEGKPERLPGLAAELVQLKVDIIVTDGRQAVDAAKNAAGTTPPIVIAAIGDAVRTKVVDSLARPGGNITGLTLLTPELSGKRLELLKETFPRMSRVAVLRNTANPGTESLKETEASATAFGLQLQVLGVESAGDLDKAFEPMTRKPPDALITLSDAMLWNHRTRIAALAIKNRLPSLFPEREFVDAGGLMAYGPSLPDLFRRAATYVDKILKGTKPADLPIEQPTKFELVINLKTAKQIGLTIPPAVLARADRVIR